MEILASILFELAESSFIMIILYYTLFKPMVINPLEKRLKNIEEKLDKLLSKNDPKE